jgi:hypothetical protein
LRSIPACRDASNVKLCGESDMAVVALYAAVFEPSGLSLVLNSPTLGNNGPDFLNVLRYLDVPHVAAMAAMKCRAIDIYEQDAGDFEFASTVVKQFGSGNIVVHQVVTSSTQQP